MNLYQSLAKIARDNPEHTAIVDGDNTYSYHDLLAAAEGIAAAVSAQTDREMAGVFLPTSGAFIFAAYGLFRAGYGMLPFNLLAPAKDLQFAMRDSGLDTVVTCEALVDKLADTPLKLIVVEDLVRAAARGIEPPVGALKGRKQPGEDDVAVLLYTSGTTGDPKGVRLTHGNIMSNVEDMLSLFDLGPEDTVIGIIPLFHTFALTATMGAPLHSGGRFVAHTRFNPEATLRDIEKYKVSLLIAVPSMYRVLTALQRAKGYDVSSLRFAIAGGEPLPKKVEREFEEVFGIELLQGYGLTETSPVIAVNRPGENRPGTVGLPLPRVKVKIVGEDGGELPPGEVGEICAAGPNIMQGYHNQPEATEQVLNGGWLHTGDMGALDEDGFLSITGRQKEMVIVGGMNVFPAEVESVLDDHPAVMMAAVVGERDEKRGESVKAFVVPKNPRLIGSEEAISFAKEMAQQAAAMGIAASAEGDGAVPLGGGPGDGASGGGGIPEPATDISSLDELESALKSHASEHLPQFKRPRSYEFRASLPIGPTGKVVKKKLGDSGKS